MHKRAGDETCLVIKLVFPTLWSPSKTIFVRLGGAEEKSAAVDGESMVAGRSDPAVVVVDVVVGEEFEVLGLWRW